MRDNSIFTMFHLQQCGGLGFRVNARALGDDPAILAIGPSKKAVLDQAWSGKFLERFPRKINIFTRF